MNYTGTVYRPPYEANSLLLQVTTGCSHNKCTFCSMYADVPFSVCPMEQIETDLDEAAERWPHTRRIFLEHGDPFALSAERLLAITDAIHSRLPEVEIIAMYASIPNIRGKSDEELRRLRDAGIGDLDIGLESGLDEALALMNKGYTSDEALEQLLRLNAAGITYIANVILGCGGPDLCRENAEATARLLNAVQPNLLFVGTLHAEPGSRLYIDMQTGAFRECTFRQLLDEQEHFIECLELEDTYYFGSHPSNIVPMQAVLPLHKEEMLEEVRKMRKHFAPRLDDYPVRGPEGSIRNR